MIILVLILLRLSTTAYLVNIAFAIGVHYDVLLQVKSIPLKTKLPAFLLLLSFVLGLSCFAQSSIDAFHTTYISSSNPNSYTATPASGSGSFSGCSSTNYSYSFNNGSSNLLKLLDITTNSKNYFITNTIATTVKLRRINNAAVTGTRSILSMESTLSSTAACPAGGQINLATPYQDVMETFLNSNYLNQGTDNIFANSGNGDDNNNNIERVDVIFPSGMQSSVATDAGFAIFDRGVDKNHDGFRIAAITSLDANGDPSSFGTLKTCVKGNGSNNGSWGHPSTANGNRTFAVYVLRKDENETQLKVSAAINQQVGGVFFSFADLGIADNQKIYGYSVIATDGLTNPTSAQLLNVNDATMYPTNTTETNGGLDMMAINAVFQTSSNPLAAHNWQLSVKQISKGNLVSWKLDEENKQATVALERSPDGNHFNDIHSMKMNAVKGSFLDSYNETAFYRLRIQSGTGNTRYSNMVFAPAAIPTPSIYPTLLKQGETLHISGVKDGRYQLICTGIDGRQHDSQITVTGRIAIARISPMLKGLIIMNLISEAGDPYHLGKLLIE